jgi:hypothetical protein
MKLHSALALKLADVDRARLNQAVHDQHFTCAPKPEGADRLFDENEFVALMAFGSLIHLGVTPRHAGPAACKVAARSAEIPREKYLIGILMETREIEVLRQSEMGKRLPGRTVGDGFMFSVGEYRRIFKDALKGIF